MTHEEILQSYLAIAVDETFKELDKDRFFEIVKKMPKEMYSLGFRAGWIMREKSNGQQMKDN